MPTAKPKSSEFIKWLREQAPGVADELEKEFPRLSSAGLRGAKIVADKSMTASSVHQTTALGNEGDDTPANRRKNKKKTRRTLMSVLEEKAQRPSVDLDKQVFDTHGSSDEWKARADSSRFGAALDQVENVGKLKLKLECTAAELQALRAAGFGRIVDALTGSEGDEPATKSGNLRTLYVMRHGATHLNDKDTSVDRIRGQVDVPLSEEGRKEADKLAKKIAKDPPDFLVCSSLSRAHETCKKVAEASGMQISLVSKGFMPWNVGKYAGMLSKDAVPILADYAVNKPDVPLEGDGESFNAFRTRFLTTLSEVFAKHPTGTIGMVSHHRNERLLSAMKAAGWPIDGSISGKEFTKKGEATAGFEIMQVPQDRIALAAVSKVWKWTDPIDLTNVFETTVVAPGDHTRVVSDYEPVEESDEAANDVYNKDDSAVIQFHVLKADRDKQMVWGWWSVTTVDGVPVVDKQDDIIPTKELERAVYEWMLNSRAQGEMHEVKSVGRCIESMMFTKEKETALNAFLREFGTGGVIDMRMEGWWGGFKVDDAQTWADIKSGKLPEFSIGGQGRREDT